MMYIALGVIGLGSFLLLTKLLWSGKVSSKNTRIILFTSIALVVVLGFLVMLAKVHPAVAFLAMLVPFLKVLLQLLMTAARMFASVVLMQKFFAAFQFGFSPHDSKQKQSDSETQTSELAMKLNHQTGTMTGTVLTGDFSGQALDSLSDDELRSVYRSLRTEESKRLLEAYIARHRANLHEESSDARDRDDRAQMSVKRAADILGVDASASEEEIVAAHRRLMDKLHPDKGGSSYLAAELNEAKQVLLAALG